MYDIAILLCLIVRGSFSDFWILRGQNLNFEVIFLEENDLKKDYSGGTIPRRGEGGLFRGGGDFSQGGLFRIAYCIPWSYICENLCPRFKSIMEDCNELKTNGNIRKIWTFNGVINFKKTVNGNERPEKIFHVEDLNKYFPE